MKRAIQHVEEQNQILNLIGRILGCLISSSRPVDNFTA